jgi:hypothetical protein
MFGGLAEWVEIVGCRSGYGKFSVQKALGSRRGVVRNRGGLE